MVDSRVVLGQVWYNAETDQRKHNEIEQVPRRKEIKRGEFCVSCSIRDGELVRTIRLCYCAYACLHMLRRLLKLCKFILGHKQSGFNILCVCLNQTQ